MKHKTTAKDHKSIASLIGRPRKSSGALEAEQCFAWKVWPGEWEELQLEWCNSRISPKRNNLKTHDWFCLGCGKSSTKVNHFYFQGFRQVLRHHDVAWVQVPMDQSNACQGIKCISNLKNPVYKWQPKIFNQQSVWPLYWWSYLLDDGSDFVQG